MRESKEGRMAISRQDFTRVWEQRDVEAVRDIYAADFCGHGFPVPKTIGRAQYRRVVELFQTAFPDCEIELEEMYADDEFVYASWQFNGTHTGTVAGIPPSGADVSFSGHGRHRHERGEVVEVWLDAEWASILRQIGRGYLGTVPGVPS
ncbi:ester cyclase [Halogeometricum limi]|uniref:SnoaL-like polyketide cyclase n=1 Tax=Halogeometricum limi TaxID=555875 RepID=A0A1I6IE42_9EURY|nr:ester cyclase [Halogeometricum limi]SFR64953.1 conserved hypothetical protein, steroid delta-isomerase-related [Halogeometricum limi]